MAVSGPPGQFESNETEPALPVKTGDANSGGGGGPLGLTIP